MAIPEQKRFDLDVLEIKVEIDFVGQEIEKAAVALMGLSVAGAASGADTASLDGPEFTFVIDGVDDGNWTLSSLQVDSSGFDTLIFESNEYGTVGIEGPSWTYESCNYAYAYKQRSRQDGTQWKTLPYIITVKDVELDWKDAVDAQVRAWFESVDDTE